MLRNCNYSSKILLFNSTKKFLRASSESDFLHFLCLYTKAFKFYFTNIFSLEKTSKFLEIQNTCIEILLHRNFFATVRRSTWKKWWDNKNLYCISSEKGRCACRFEGHDMTKYFLPKISIKEGFLKSCFWLNFAEIPENNSSEIFLYKISNRP